jgi:histidinol-phosphate aminotransferase
MSIFRPDVERMAGYTPGEQPQEPGWVKLNTNENPYPPSPRVREAIEAAARGPLNLYPDPLGTEFRRAAAELFQVDPEWILPGNGSDEILTILTRTFVDAGQLIVYPYPSYILYETLADLQAARHARMLLQPDWSWDPEPTRRWMQLARLAFVPNPNSPSGSRWTNDDLARLLPEDGVLVLDEAYGDFADPPHRGELLRGDHGSRMVITRTLSKSYSLAGIRFGFAVAHPDVIAGLRKVKDSYNCDRLALAAATAAIRDQAWMTANVERIRRTRGRLTSGLEQLGWHVVPSQANFVWATHPGGRHRDTYLALKQRRILLRYMVFPDVAWAPAGQLDGLRVTVGTDEEIDALLHALNTLGG